MEITSIDINKIIPYANNAKEHPQWQIDQIKSSITEFGFNDPIAIDENNVIIEGHGRFIALQQLEFEEVEVIILKHLTSIQKREYILFHNKSTMNTGFNEVILKLELEDIMLEKDLELTGFREEEIEVLGILLEEEKLIEVENEEVKLKINLEVIVNCKNEEELEQTYDKLLKEGYDCRILT